MRKTKYIIGALVIGLLAGFGTGSAFAEVPNGRVNSDAPEPSESIVTIGETPEASEEGVMPISETENPTEDTSTDNSAAEAENGAETEVIEEETSTEITDNITEMWPVYLSLGGIVLTLLLIFVINIVHRKSKK